MKDNKNTDSVFSIDKIADFCKANVRYISGGVMTFALVLVLSVSACDNKNSGNSSSGKQDSQQEETVKDDNNSDQGAEDMESDVADDSQQPESHPEITELVSTYYNSYAAGDLDKLSQLAKYLSDMEKDYIKMMNEHVESYDNVSCMVETGRTEDEYIVLASYDMKLAGVEGSLPGINIFYVQTNKQGELYINNRYSSFNREIKEQKTKKKILNLITEFENSEEVQKLQLEIQAKYDKTMEGSDELQKRMNEVTEAILKWKENYSAPEPEEPKEEEQKPEEPKQEEQKPEEQPADDSASENDSSEADASADSSSQDDSSDDGESSGINYVPEGKVLTANNGYNVRSSMSETAELLGTTAVGDSIKVILSYAEGWTKVEWNGTTGYIRTDLLLNN
ncbi:MAG: SH3 domain-containing protein [Lachnospiraceae bacterium]|nr:SH3 domain-containing protein [Lachnospiraceae bacterium]